MRRKTIQTPAVLKKKIAHLGEGDKETVLSLVAIVEAILNNDKHAFYFLSLLDSEQEGFIAIQETTDYGWASPLLKVEMAKVIAQQSECLLVSSLDNDPLEIN